jgi:hypothetical protein
VVGRQTNRALIALTFTDGEIPAAFFQTVDLGAVFQLPALNGILYYYNMYVSCLTPGARAAFATALDPVNINDSVYSVEMAEVDFGDGLNPWTPGVNLFSVACQSGTDESAAITTVVVDGSVRRIDLSQLTGLQSGAIAASLLGKPLGGLRGITSRRKARL